MAISREDLKKKRLQALAVVGSHMDASAAMFDRVVAAGQKVAAARDAAETAQMGALDAQVADLNEMAEDMAEFGQAAANPPKGAAIGSTPSGAIAAPAKVTATLSPGSEALKALNAAQPRPRSEAWEKGDAYLGTHPETKV